MVSTTNKRILLATVLLFGLAFFFSYKSYTKDGVTKECRRRRLMEEGDGTNGCIDKDEPVKKKPKVEEDEDEEEEDEKKDNPFEEFRSSQEDPVKISGQQYQISLEIGDGLSASVYEALRTKMTMVQR